MRESIERAFFEYVGIKPGQRLLLVGESCDLVHEVEQCLSSRLSLSFAERSLPYSELESRFSNFDVVVFFENNTSTYSSEVRTWLRSFAGSIPVYRMFDFSEELFEKAFLVPAIRIRQLNDSLLNAGRNASTITVKSAAGTDLEIKLSHKYGWINSYGAFSPGKPGVLPAGEVATFSDEINGVLVADGAVNTNFGYPSDPRLESRPITVQIEHSVGQTFQATSIIDKTLLRSFLALPFSNHIGEVGFGTNIGLSSFVSFVSHINERYPALHLGFGANNQGEKLVPWSCPFHLDLILRDCEIFFDDELILKNGRYSESALMAKPQARDVLVAFADTL